MKMLRTLPWLLVVLTASLSRADEPAAGEPVLVEPIRGKLPLIITAPHGGTLNVPGAEPRRDKTTPKFITSRDSGTDDLALKLAAEIEKSLGERPYVVLMRAHRKYLDANRPPELAYESERQKAVYDEFHAAVTGFRREIHDKWGGGMLVDVHGQVRERAAVFRGTANGQTMKRLIDEHGDSVPKQLSVALEKAGLRMLPPSDTAGEEVVYTGGHVVRAHGTSHEGGLDAVQLEFGSKLRRRQARAVTARETAAGLVDFLKQFYLAPAE